MEGEIKRGLRLSGEQVERRVGVVTYRGRVTQIGLPNQWTIRKRESTKEAYVGEVKGYGKGVRGKP